MSEYNDIDYGIEEKLGVLSEKGPITKEVNIIRWGNAKSMYDIRKWKGDEPLKGISLTEDEAIELLDILKSALV